MENEDHWVLLGHVLTFVGLIQLSYSSSSSSGWRGATQSAWTSNKHVQHVHY